MRIEPITPHLGAEVFDIDVGAMSEGEVDAVKQAFLDHHVLVFRDQALTREQHKDFGRLWGTLHVHPSHQLRNSKDDKEIFFIRTTPKTRYANGEAWHTDISCEPIPPLGSMLYIKELPGPAGGDTLFANMHLAFESLSAPLQNMLRELTALHDGRKDLAAYDVQLQPDQDYPRAVHPVITRHPDTGREILFVNRSFTERIEEFTREESAALLEMLWRHVENNPRLHCRVRWQPNTLTFWDNRCTWHHAVWDYYPQTRYGERVSICDDRPPSR